MLEKPIIVQTEAQPMACLHVTVTREKIMEVMGPAIREVMGAVAAQGMEPSGPWFTHHLRRPTDTFDFEVCVPVSKPIQAAGRVKPGAWPAMRVARAVYSGGYDGLGAAWGEFLAWIEAQKLKTTEDLWERYSVGPESGRDTTKYRTELNRPLC